MPNPRYESALGDSMFTGVPGAAIEEGPTHLDGPASLGTGKARAYSVYSGGFAATYTNDGSTADQLMSRLTVLQQQSPVLLAGYFW